MSTFDLDTSLCQRRPRVGHCNAEFKERQFGNICRLLDELVVRSYLKECGRRGTRKYLKSNIDTAAACPCTPFFPAAGQFDSLARKRSHCLLHSHISGQMQGTCQNNLQAPGSHSPVCVILEYIAMRNLSLTPSSALKAATSL